MEADGSNLSRLTDDGAGGLGSLLGPRMAATSPSCPTATVNSDIYVMELRQEEDTDETTSDGELDGGLDGPLAAGAIRRLTNFGQYANPRFPVWSPDGRHIAFEEESGVNRNIYDIYVMEADGSNQRNLTNREGRYSRWHVWSPDVRHIAFVSDRDGNPEIYVMEASWSNRRRLADHRDDDWDPSWSPDGGILPSCPTATATGIFT